MTTTFLAKASALLLFVGVASGANAQPTKLDARELAVGELSFRADTGVLRRVLGAPQRIADGSWYWSGIEVTVERGAVHQIRLTDNSRETPRGLRVGDSADRVRSLYGEPCVAKELIFCVSIDPHDGFDERGIAVKLDDEGRVARIFIGAVFAL